MVSPDAAIPCLPLWTCHGHAVVFSTLGGPKASLIAVVMHYTHAHKPRLGLGEPLVLGNTSAYMSHLAWSPWATSTVLPHRSNHHRLVEVGRAPWQPSPRLGTHYVLDGGRREAPGAASHVRLTRPPCAHVADVPGMICPTPAASCDEIWQSSFAVTPCTPPCSWLDDISHDFPCFTLSASSLELCHAPCHGVDSAVPFGHRR